MYIKLPEKRYYRIGEIAKAFRVNPSLIRFWEKEFDLLQPKKNAKGDRLFTEEDVKNLQMIHHLVKEKGFTLDGAKAKMKAEKKEIIEKQEIINKLELIKRELINIKNQL
ncbi:MAG: MerR family transcriptional regulator [Flavobacteriaceae bacterium]|nr:MerR family transcriptional regulator [Flavobacteriaceae bacterium]